MGERGPAPDLFSGRSDRNGRMARVTYLPAKGCSKRAPKFPLTAFEGGATHDAGAVNAREQAVWRQVWHLPQAVAWHMPRYSYLVQTVAMYVRALVRSEQSDATAADRNVVLRFADMVGLTPNGLARLGWVIQDDGVQASRPALHVVGGVNDPRDEWEQLNGEVE